jgi:hypothetical protein
VHHYLIREGTRTNAGLVVESGEAREVMHFALLIGYGAGAINPYLAFETLSEMVSQDLFPPEITFERAYKHYIKSINKALLKVIAKMGISTIKSYRGAQLRSHWFDAELVDRYFTGTSRIKGSVETSGRGSPGTSPSRIRRRTGSQSLAGRGRAIPVETKGVSSL